MENQKDHVRVCPTRIDGETALFAHKVAVDQCHERQRGRYHKCYTCIYNHSYVAVHGFEHERQLAAARVKAV